MTPPRAGIRIEDINSAFRIVDGDNEITSRPGELLGLTLVAEFAPCGKQKFHHGNSETCSRVKHIHVPPNASGPDRAAFIIKAQELLGKIARQCPACSVS